MKKIGFIGVGVMGTGMVRNLMKNGFSVQIFSRTKSKCEDVIAEGAVWCDSVAECVSDCDAVITMVGYPKDVEEVYFGEQGILEAARIGTYLVDMTTTSPELSERMYWAGKEKGLFVLDAPVSGGDLGAQNGTLSIMTGGDRDAFDACLPIFQAMGNNIIYEGAAGTGQHTKMANQIAIAGALVGVCEALSYGAAAGLDLEAMLASISAGAAGSWQMTNNAPKMLSGDFAPGFFVKHYLKDMEIAAQESERKHIALPVLDKVLGMFQELAEEGGLEWGTQAVIRYYEKLNQHTITKSE